MVIELLEAYIMYFRYMIFNVGFRALSKLGPQEDLFP